MDSSCLYALRLGFSTRKAKQIQQEGLAQFIRNQLSKVQLIEEPPFIKESPKSLKELQELKQNIEKNTENSQELVQKQLITAIQWKKFLLERIYNAESPLLEKIYLFWQNHFVVTYQSVKIPYWIFLHYKTIQVHALGNYKTLVVEMVYSNAMIKYLDNQQNRKGKSNENLARELLELFTLGEGNYTESDIKNTALALAGLMFGEEKATYRPKITDNSTKIFMGESGNFKIDDIVEIIFRQPQTATFITRKFLKWFFYDEPEEIIVSKYASYLQSTNYELKPFYEKILVEECKLQKSGTQIKNPLIFTYQILHDLQITQPNFTFITFLLKNQSMDIYDQPNVKGWKGANDWLTTQKYTDRHRFIDFLLKSDKNIIKLIEKKLEKLNLDEQEIDFKKNLEIHDNTSAYTILEELKNRLLFVSNPEIDNALSQLLTYDYNAKTDQSKAAIYNVYEYLVKTPEFQII